MTSNNLSIIRSSASHMCIWIKQSEDLLSRVIRFRIWICTHSVVWGFEPWKHPPVPRRQTASSKNKAQGRSIIAALRHGGKSGKIARVNAPFDIMYGFRGSKYNVDLLSPFQMCMHWQCIEVKHPDYRCPETFKTVSHSQWTEAGKKFKKIQKESGKRMPEYIPGDHCVVIDKPDHIILPNIPQLGNLPHVWMWCRRSRPYVPVWSYAKVPKSKLSPNENGRLLNVYMRPWTLNPADATADNVLLSDMALCKEDVNVTALVFSVSNVRSWGLTVVASTSTVVFVESISLVKGETS